ncbi:GDP-L-galactose phosphorylase 1-like protein [Quillaja saponaria]|uniref:GDP-L-galactose phosphorylase 1-like protein n=1 Tax=Quillaja saponaria TaxID=32244 RepID=A0AAD7LT38_QUISA|nr:GDP-L-galactose phosphorylase 1-like protein [Quillaja saponaria]
MLRIKRVPTVVSNYQKEDAEETARREGGCGRNCLNKCCIQGAKLPLYAFKKLDKSVGEKGLIEHEGREPPVAFLDSLLLGEWEDRMQRGLFRYDVTACETKVIPGEYGFIAQLNEGRHLKKRPTEFRVDKVLQPFDGNKFNFTKVGQEEVIFQLEASDDGEVQFFPNAPIDVDSSPSVVAINVSPIEYGHVLLIPLEAGNPYFRLGYNSLGAFATINHLHFQAYYLAVPFPIEKALTKKIAILNGGVKISELLGYPANFSHTTEKQALGEVSAELLDTQVNPAVWEISGHMVLKRKKDYDEASEGNAWRLLAEVSLSEERFQEVNGLIFESIACDELDVKPESLDEIEAINPTSHPTMLAESQQCLVLQ